MATPQPHKHVVKLQLLQPGPGPFDGICFRLRPDPLTLAGLKCVLVRVAPTGAEEPTMDLRKLPLGIEVADPEATGGGTVGLGEDPN